MNFGVIGTGDIGAVIVKTLRDAGYPVKMANSRGPESLKDLGAKTGAIPVHSNKPFRMSMCSSFLFLKRRFQNYR